MNYTVPFSQLDKTNIPTAGGKGANLGEMTAAGLPVPAGFVLTTAAYDAFVTANGLQKTIMTLAEGANSAEIAALFLKGEMPEAISDDLLSAWQALDATAVAVRSSATAEDLPSASFAGQQDTFLNIREEAALLVAVKRCWASLWTARAIAYRQRQGIAPETVRLAVVVQELVDAEASGILFTADPTSGERDHVLINGTWGLGEAIVTGLVTPDTAVVDKTNWQIVSQETATKTMMTVRTAAGTEEIAVPMEKQNVAVLDGETAVSLAQLGAQIEAHYGTPMDIEWAIADGKIAILQARPITALPAEPLKNVVWDPPTPKTVWMRRQIVEHMSEPLSPLFEDLYLEQGLDQTLADLLDSLGAIANVQFDLERMMPHGFAKTINGYAYTTMTANLDAQTVQSVLKIYPRILKMLNMPDFDWEGHVLPAYQALIARWEGVDLELAESSELLQGIRELAAADSAYWFGSAAYLGLSRFLDSLFDALLKSPLFRSALPTQSLGSSAFLRGFDSKALEAQAEMEQIAATIRASDFLRDLVLKTAASQLQTALASQPEGQPVVERIERYITHYGHQIYNLDFVAPTQGEDPQPLLLSLKAFVKQPPAQPVRARQAQMAAERDKLVEETAQNLNPVLERLFRFVWKWTKQFAPYREHVMFYMGAAWPTVRKLASELGQRLATAEVISRPDDIYYLESQEIETAVSALANGSAPTFAARVQERRALRESRKLLTAQPKVPAQSAVQIGPLKLTMFDPTPPEAATMDGPILNGYAVSTGRVTAPASVIQSTADFEKMQPDSILVCTTTTPAWTPLFAQAVGLVTDVGGALAHGSIVAREYGIPAVMGTGVATKRIQSGAMLAIDGDAGTVTLLDEVEETTPLTNPMQAHLPNAESGKTAVVNRKKWVIAMVIGAVAGLLWWRRRQNNS